MGTKVNVALVYGGKSGEHEVSLQTAFAVMGEFDYDKYAITPSILLSRASGELAASLEASRKPPASCALQQALPERASRLLRCLPV